MAGATATAARLVIAPVAAASLGAVVAARKRLSSATTSVLQHLAAGIVIAAVAGEVLPIYATGTPSSQPSSGSSSGSAASSPCPASKHAPNTANNPTVCPPR